MNEKVVAIILSAGRGKRMNSAIPKQYLKLGDKEVLYYTLKAYELSRVDEIIVVAGKEDIEYCKNDIIEKYGISKVTKVVPGGAERYESVLKGLEVVEQASYVLIHDGARPCIEVEDINGTIDCVREYKACIVAVKAKDTIKVVRNGAIVDSPDRETMWQAQTPQAFSYNEILQGYRSIKGKTSVELKKITDDASVWSLVNELPVRIYEGKYTNIKITTEEDLEIARKNLM